MPTIDSRAGPPGLLSADVALLQLEKRLPPLLSVIAGMVDLTGFLTLGNLFTAHITGNLVVIAALAVRGGRINPAQILAVPMFVVAVAGTWLLAHASDKRGLGLLRLLLLVQFLLLTVVFTFSVITKPSADPHGMMALIAAMMAVSAMACQFALLRLVWPIAPSTAVMTGNLTNATLSAMNVIFPSQAATPTDMARLKASVRLLVGFFGGCVLAATAVAYCGDWAWIFPATLAAIATRLQ
jgi:uncharacterized membrane protein YoaK (UPF0700 family)